MRDEDDEFRFESGDNAETTLRAYGRGLSKLRREMDELKTQRGWLMGAGAAVGGAFTLFSKQILGWITSLGGH